MDYRKVMQLGLLPLSRTKPPADADADADAPESAQTLIESGESHSRDDGAGLSIDDPKQSAAG
ncbi:MAG TPA: hypothetical protein PKA88_29200 [Polyangiaceae bacterium]|nr:hypothetical protein [Polyangiaceae bacterium]